jgi:hypothetical protein
MRDPIKACRSMLLLAVPCLLIDYAIGCGLYSLYHWLF